MTTDVPVTTPPAARAVGSSTPATPPLDDLRALVTCADANRPDLPILAPFTGRLLGAVPACTPVDVAEALRRARAAQPGWAATPVSDRRDVLLRFHDRLLEWQDRLIDLIQLEAGKARLDAFEEVPGAAVGTRYYAYHGPDLLRSRRRSGVLPGLTHVRELRTPVGVVGIIAPWNYPLTLAVADAIPAILAGNTVVLKPAEQTPFTALLCRQMLLACGLPTDVFQIVTGDGAILGPPLIDGVDFIQFTGSTAIGRTVARRAGERLIKCSLELGGKNPMLILADGDLDAAVEGALRGCFTNAGQLCISFERIYVHRSLYERFVKAFAGAAGALTIGPGFDYDTRIGSLISNKQLERVTRHVDDARSHGATVRAGGRPRPDLGPFFYEPTVLTGVTPEMQVAQEETFGPVVSVYPFDDLDEAVALANASDYGLNASVWTRDVKLGQNVAARIRCGSVNVNEAYAAAFGSIDAPMGGMKASGLGRRHGREGLLKFTEAQTIASQRLLPIAPPPAVGPSRYAATLNVVLQAFRHIPGLR